MWTPDYYVRYADFPRTVNAVTMPNDNGTFDIYINSALPDEAQTEALAHEVRHIRREHFYAECKTITEIENEAKKKKRLPPLNTEDKILCFNSLDALARYVEALQKEIADESTRTEKTAER